MVVLVPGYRNGNTRPSFGVACGRPRDPVNLFVQIDRAVIRPDPPTGSLTFPRYLYLFSSLAEIRWLAVCCIHCTPDTWAICYHAQLGDPWKEQDCVVQVFL